ncbi:MAG: DUF2194 domain-containing protein [Balneolaceae bacterium]|nr:DUF2194 domain-containing protein [Balneolaceae bacterium]
MHYHLGDGTDVGSKHREARPLRCRGNSLFTTLPVWDQRYGYLLGIRPQAEYAIQDSADGFQFKGLAFPGFTDGSYAQSIPYYHSGFHKNMFTESINVVATSKDSLQSPVIIENKIGKGTSTLFNSRLGEEKTYRGILFSMVLKMLEGVAYPVANTSTIFLDDFPAPLYNEKMPPIDWEYDITHAEYVIQHWWPDMQQLANQFNIDYSAMTSVQLTTPTWCHHSTSRNGPKADIGSRCR